MTAFAKWIVALVLLSSACSDDGARTTGGPGRGEEKSPSRVATVPVAVGTATSEKGTGSVTYADGMLYTLSENRKMGLVKPSPAGHTVVSRFTVPSGGEAPSWAHPVVCGGRLYVRHSDRLYAYDVRAKGG